MAEITKLINKSGVLTWITNAFLKTFFYSIRRITKKNSYDTGKIVIVSLHKLGDSVITIPAIREIQKNYNKRIAVVCYPEAVPVYKLGLSDIEFCSLGHEDFSFNSRLASGKARKKLQSLNPEIIFDLTGVMTSASLIFNSGAKKITGMNREQFRSIYDYFVPVRKTPHLFDRYLDVASLLISGIDREKAKVFPRELNNENKKILIHPFAGWKAKEWNYEKYINLAERLKNKYDISIIIPEDNPEPGVLSEIKNKGLSFIETHSIDDLIECIKSCTVFIGNDSGPLHIASLMGKATFSIFGPTNPEFHIPLGDHHSFCLKEIKCSPAAGEQLCFTNGGRSGCPSFKCMNTLSTDEVYSRIIEYFQKINFNTASA